MANNYYDATGVLELKQVTPVIHALFDAFDLDPAYPGKGWAYIARASESSPADWDTVREGLEALATARGLPLMGEDTSVSGCLRMLMADFHVEHREDLCALIARDHFEDDADLEALFLIATCFDDGHGLISLTMEAAWHSDKARLFEFGGDSLYLSREVQQCSGSTQAMDLGPALQQALALREFDRAAACLNREVQALLNGIRDEDARKAVAARLFDTPREIAATAPAAGTR